MIKKQIPRLEVEHFEQATVLRKALEGIRAVIRYRQPVEKRIIGIFIFFDASFNVSKESTYGQTGLITGV